jgi:hypothetical protein
MITADERESRYGSDTVPGLFAQVSRPDAREGGFDGLRVDMPHEGADVLDLPAPGAMALYFTREFDGCLKLFGQRHGFQVAQRQVDQLLTQALEGPVFIFLLGSAFIFRIHFAGFPLPVLQRWG